MKTSNLIFFISILVLTSFGLVILFASSSFISQQEYSDPYYYIKKQGVSTFIGLLLLFFYEPDPLPDMVQGSMAFVYSFDPLTLLSIQPLGRKRSRGRLQMDKNI